MTNSPDAFARSEPHRRIINRLRPLMEQTSFEIEGRSECDQQTVHILTPEAMHNLTLFARFTYH
ncbi:hypothetical protein AFE_1838 [Acidithiobacillus ferrooxidans ATCC 23270]|uniref:Uncharacterized protein n=1 Tax=Acidithiobacillus ferrooxidans (strain ATCC 23270 / DSM 14882 / CIP 104768 / NCIMB 8455) TaxID=243159 RepID=B7JBU4_ACIF2|nr:hypothetical protein AFE_1838 [Acidithiobacillus ferrooxidans ATCC 23270]